MDKKMKLAGEIIKSIILLLKREIDEEMFFNGLDTIEDLYKAGELD